MNSNVNVNEINLRTDWSDHVCDKGNRWTVYVVRNFINSPLSLCREIRSILHERWLKLTNKNSISHMTSTFSHDSIQNSFMSFRKRRKLEMEQKNGTNSHSHTLSSTSFYDFRCFSFLYLTNLLTISYSTYFFDFSNLEIFHHWPKLLELHLYLYHKFPGLFFIK